MLGAHTGHPCQAPVMIRLALHLLSDETMKDHHVSSQTKYKTEKDEHSELTPEETEMIQEIDETLKIVLVRHLEKFATK